MKILPPMSRHKIYVLTGLVNGLVPGGTSKILRNQSKKSIHLYHSLASIRSTTAITEIWKHNGMEPSRILWKQGQKSITNLMQFTHEKAQYNSNQYIPISPWGNLKIHKSVTINGACPSAIITGDIILVPCHVVKSIQLIRRSGTYSRPRTWL